MTYRYAQLSPAPSVLRLPLSVAVRWSSDQEMPSDELRISAAPGIVTFAESSVAAETPAASVATTCQ